MAHGYLNGGWRNKYFIAKWTHDDDGSPTGLRWADPEAEYFVMRYDMDPHARAAMEAYAQSVKADNPQFADDIMRKLLETSDTEGARLQKGQQHPRQKGEGES